MKVHSHVGIITNSSSEVFIANDSTLGDADVVLAAIQAAWDEICDHENYDLNDVTDVLKVEVVENQERLKEILDGGLGWYLDYYSSNAHPSVGSILIWSTDDNSIDWDLMDWIEYNLGKGTYRIHLG